MDIYEAARQGSVDDIEFAIETGCEVNVPDQNFRTPLFFAVHNGHIDACRTLIARGAIMDDDSQIILDLAIRGGHAEILELLWPYCKVETEYRCLERAVSLGFHDIADFLVGTGQFKYQLSDASEIEMIKKNGFQQQEMAAFQQWERYIFARGSEKIDLHRVFFDYALLLAAKADRNAGLRLVNFLLEGENPLADVNCMINVAGEIETPLTNAAEKGNLKILENLIGRQDIMLAICGKYNWPAFLHLLANSQSIASEKGQAIAQTLSTDTICDSFLIDNKGTRLEAIFENVLRHGNDALVMQVIELVHGTAGMSILPLLIRANEAKGLRWVLNDRTAGTLKPPPILWVLLCNFFEENANTEAWKLFIQVAEFFVKNAIWDRMILVCLSSRNLRFVKQFFYPLREIQPREVTEETTRGLSQASTNQSLLQEWVDRGFASTTLWSAIVSGLWKSPAFELLISHANIDPNEPFQGKVSLKKEADNLPPSFSWNSIGEKRKLSTGSPAGNPLRFPGDPNMMNSVQQDYQNQLILLEQQNKRRLMMARGEQERIKTGGSLQETMWNSPLAFAAACRNIQLVEVLLRISRVNVNSQDVNNQTPLILAITLKDSQVVSRLLEIGGTDLNLRDNKGRTAIFHAAQVEDLHLVQLLKGSHRVDLSIRDCDGRSVYDFAKLIGNQDVIAALAS
ncbi:uncharacterized protein N7511_007937 [Penicillium nucicola]|uniref:uncharacterized protein n=1 Tax=Penicillium nucicola TaxID=1850975 RepID=UPI002545B147|nr:uncharacterized protein N7511_007937 [Penicillium nucicola]KAJ5753784.1 hypothetical protein N7511_007937 [Penicillium nucicola]